jgi:hypothetical protein
VKKVSLGRLAGKLYIYIYIYIYTHTSISLNLVARHVFLDQYLRAQKEDVIMLHMTKNTFFFLKKKKKSFSFFLVVEGRYIYLVRVIYKIEMKYLMGPSDI